MKAGTGIKKDSQNRIFYLWEDAALKKLLGDFGFTVIDAAISKSAKNSKDLWLGYVLKVKFS
jgi:hypothetical protein